MKLIGNIAGALLGLLALISVVTPEDKKLSLDRHLETVTLWLEYNRPVQWFNSLLAPRLAFFWTWLSITGIVLYAARMAGKSDQLAPYIAFIAPVFSLLPAWMATRGPDPLVSFNGLPTLSHAKTYWAFLWREIAMSFGALLYLAFAAFVLGSEHVPAVIKALLTIPLLIAIAIVALGMSAKLIVVYPAILLTTLLLLVFYGLDFVFGVIRRYLWWLVSHPKGAWVVFSACLVFLLSMIKDFFD